MNGTRAEAVARAPAVTKTPGVGEGIEAAEAAHGDAIDRPTLAVEEAVAVAEGGATTICGEGVGDTEAAEEAAGERAMAGIGDGGRADARAEGAEIVLEIEVDGEDAEAIADEAGRPTARNGSGGRAAATATDAKAKMVLEVEMDGTKPSAEARAGGA